MSSLKKRQHYVWRYYLKPWAQEENINAYYIQEKKVLYPGLMTVAQERYFYKLYDLEDSDKRFIMSFIDQAAASLKGLNMLFFTLFNSVYEVKKKVLPDAKIDKNKAEEMIRELDINTMEDAHSHIENMGMKLLATRDFDTFKNIVASDDLFDAMMFLCFQYFRTRNMRNNAVNSAETPEAKALTERTWNVISFILPSSVARSLSVDMRTRYRFITNDTETPFLTCDQPVFNLLSDDTDENGAAKELEFFYPITPTIAITIHRRHEEQLEQCIHVKADEIMAEHYNILIGANADRWVFAQTAEEIQNVALALAP